MTAETISIFFTESCSKLELFFKWLIWVIIELKKICLKLLSVLFKIISALRIHARILLLIFEFCQFFLLYFLLFFIQIEIIFCITKPSFFLLIKFNQKKLLRSLSPLISLCSSQKVSILIWDSLKVKFFWLIKEESRKGFG